MARYKRGSTPKLTQELIDALAQAIRSGATIEGAVDGCGVSKDTFYRWVEAATGRYSNPLLIELIRSIELAMADADIRDFGVTDLAAQNSVRRVIADRLKRLHAGR